MSLADLKPESLEGGFIVRRHRVWQGVIRTREDKRIVWSCKHAHSRPEYNARWSFDDSQAWEVSALNCGRAAYRQLLDEEKVVGDIGLVDSSIPPDMRDDARKAVVGEDTYLGSVRLDKFGRRILTVSHVDRPMSGTVDVDKGVSGVVAPLHHSPEEVKSWATAAWLLKGGVWGVVFQDPGVPMKVDAPIERAIAELLGSGYAKKLDSSTRDSKLVLPSEYTGSTRKGQGSTRRTRTPSKPEKLGRPTLATPKVKPHLKVEWRDGRRVYEVIGPDGRVDTTHVHRGAAVEALNKLLEAS